VVVSPSLEVRHDPRSSHLGPAERQDRRIQTGGKRVLRHAPKKIRETSGRETTDLRSSEIRTPSVDSDEGERGSDQKKAGEEELTVDAGRGPDNSAVAAPSNMETLVHGAGGKFGLELLA